MKVKELIKALQDIDQDKEIKFNTDEYGMISIDWLLENDECYYLE
jgi:hypothetical protein